MYKRQEEHHEILEKCQVLKEYSQFMEIVQNCQISGEEEPYKKAIKECIEKGSGSRVHGDCKRCGAGIFTGRIAGGF